MTRNRLLALACLVTLGLSAAPARAGLVVTIAPDLTFTNVVATGAGTIDLSGLTFLATGNAGPSVRPSIARIGLGPAGVSTPVDLYQGVSGPSSFGLGTSTSAPTSGFGDFVGLQNSITLVVPRGYVSGDPLAVTNTYAGKTLADLGLTPGTYVYRLGAGTDADTFTVIVSATPLAGVPEPATMGMAALGVASAGAVVRRFRRRPAGA